MVPSAHGQILKKLGKKAGKAAERTLERRAEPVMNTLISLYNAAPERLTAKGLGEKQPVRSNDSPEGKAQNRRVEFIKQ